MTFMPFKGVIAPNLTPFNDDLSVAIDLYVSHAMKLLAGRCAALAPFGTTGEALSVSSDERIEAIKALIEAGIDPAHLIPGTGLANLPETAHLSQSCLDMGCAAIMALPPFYYKNVSEDGLFAYFAELIKHINRSNCRIFLYHIPQVAGVGMPVPLVARLKREFPDEIVGIKDSSGDLDNTLALLEIKDLIVYPGSELPLLETMPKGAPGCISATANINGERIAEIISLMHKGSVEEAGKKFKQVKKTRLIFQKYAPIPAQKRLLAISSGDIRWAIVRPPLEPLMQEDGEKLLSEFSGE